MKALNEKTFDPRIKALEKNLKEIKKTVVVCGPKGGVGKSSLATVLALLLSQQKTTGLFDLDFHNSSSITLLGAEEFFPEEEKGVKPPEVKNLKFMSINYYVKQKPCVLRGSEVTDAFLELFTITKWGRLDFLVIDSPPGLGDAFLDLLRFLKDPEFLLVTTGSILSVNAVKKLLFLLDELNFKVIGVVNNFKDNFPKITEAKVKEKLVGEISFDPDFEKAVGDPEKLLRTRFAYEVKKQVLPML